MQQISRKYQTSGRIINIIKNEAIPQDEPLMLLRGRDRLVPAALEFYLHLRADVTTDNGARVLLADEIAAMRQWQADHPGRTRLPDQGGRS